MKEARYSDSSHEACAPYCSHSLSLRVHVVALPAHVYKGSGSQGDVGEVFRSRYRCGDYPHSLCWVRAPLRMGCRKWEPENTARRAKRRRSSSTDRIREGCSLGGSGFWCPGNPHADHSVSTRLRGARAATWNALINTLISRPVP